MKTLRFALLYAVLTISAISVSAAPLSFTSPTGDRTITAYDSGLVVYQSANGVLEMQVSEAGLQIPGFSLLATSIHHDGEVLRLHVSVKHGTELVEDDLQVNVKSGVARGRKLGEVRRVLHSFLESSQGQLLQEAKQLILANSVADASGRLSPVSGAALARTSPQFSPDGSFWGCAGSILNGVAAGAAAIGGCATPACGPAYKLCCGSGVAWYGAALIDLATGDCQY